MVRSSQNNFLGGLAALVLAACSGGSNDQRAAQAPIPTPAPPTAPAPSPTPAPTPTPTPPPVTPPRQPPVYGHTAGIGFGNVIVEDPNHDELLSVDIQTGTSTILVSPYQNFRTSTQGNISHFVQGVEGSRIFLSRGTLTGQFPNQQFDNDIVVLDKSGIVLVDTNTPNSQENIERVLPNGTAFTSAYNPQTFSILFGILDPITRATQDMFPDNTNNPATRRAFHYGQRGNNAFIFTEEGGIYTAHAVNLRTGSETLLTTIDSTTTPFGHFDKLDRDVVTFIRHQAAQELVFRNQGIDTVFLTPNAGLDYSALAATVTSFGQLRAIVRQKDWGTNTTELLGLLAQSGAVTPQFDRINFSAFPGWEPHGYQESIADAGGRLVAIEGNGPDPLPPILFYDRFSNTVSDRITPMLPGATRISGGMESYNGKALIQLNAQVPSPSGGTRFVDKAVTCDGDDATDQFGAYNNSRRNQMSSDGRYGIVEAIAQYTTGSAANPQQHTQTDLILRDIETNGQVQIGTITDGSFASAFSDDGQRIAYAKQDHQTQRSELWTYDIATGQNEKVYEGRSIGFIPHFKGDKIVVRSFGAPNEDITVDLSRRNPTTNLAEAVTTSLN